MRTKNSFTFAEKVQLDEVRRRIREFKNSDKNAPMILLCFPSEAKTLVEKGILTPYSNEIKRCLSWYNLTEKGKQII